MSTSRAAEPQEKRAVSPDSPLEDETERRHSLAPTTTRPSIAVSAAERARRSINARLANPLLYYTYAELRKMGRAYAYDNALAEEDDVRAMEIGACLARDPTNLEHAKELGITGEELDVLQNEINHRWSQPWTLYAVIALCSLCAAVQGMDETVVNGAQLFYAGQFGIGHDDSRSTWLVGLVNAAPYLSCTLCVWLTTPLNNWFGRRGTIFITCVFSAVACLWQGFVSSWWSMFIARMALGLGLGPKSTTVPIYAAEMCPPAIRGGLTSMWQMWTAFGIMLGYAADLGFYGIRDTKHIVGLNWRLMMASACLPAVVVCVFVFLAPESPRWYLSKGRHAAAYQAMTRLRYNKIQAARDLFYMAELLRAEENMRIGQSKIREFWAVRRNRRALLASEIVMFMQQFCGVNVIAYYSSSIFAESGFSDQSALTASLGFGVINFLFTLPRLHIITAKARNKN